MTIDYDITFHPKWWWKNADIDFSQDFFDNPQVRINADITMRRTLFDRFAKYNMGEEHPAPRPLLGTNLLAAGYLHSEILGCDIQYSKDNSPIVLHGNLDLDEIDEQFSYNGLESSPVWEKVEAQVEYLNREYGKVEPYINLMGVQNIAMDLAGQAILMAYYDCPENVHLFFRGITDCLLDTGRRLKELSNSISEGVTAIIGRSFPQSYLTSNCSCEMIPNAIYEEFILPYDTELAREFGSFGVHHCGESMEHLIRGYSRIPNTDFLEIGAGSDVKAIRDAFPDTFLNLRVSPLALTKMNRAQLEKHIYELVYAGNNADNRFSISCVGIDDGVTDEEIVNFLDICDQIKL